MYLFLARKVCPSYRKCGVLQSERLRAAAAGSLYTHELGRDISAAVKSPCPLA